MHTYIHSYIYLYIYRFGGIHSVAKANAPVDFCSCMYVGSSSSGETTNRKNIFPGNFQGCCWFCPCPICFWQPIWSSRVGRKRTRDGEHLNLTTN